MKRWVHAATDESKVLIDDTFLENLYTELNNAGCGGDDSDLVTNNLRHEYEGYSLDLYHLIDLVTDAMIDAAEGGGLSEDEMEDVRDYVYDVVPDAVRAAAGI